jgi:hypothetical protein
MVFLAQGSVAKSPRAALELLHLPLATQMTPSCPTTYCRWRQSSWQIQSASPRNVMSWLWRELSSVCHTGGRAKLHSPRDLYDALTTQAAATPNRLSPPDFGHFSMPSVIVFWNGLYSAHPALFVMRRIQAHYNRFALFQRGAIIANIRYVSSQNAAHLLMKHNPPRRPTGWHGSSGAARFGGHLTVDFRSSRNEHITTHHVYPTDNAYPSLCKVSFILPGLALILFLQSV